MLRQVYGEILSIYKLIDLAPKNIIILPMDVSNSIGKLLGRIIVADKNVTTSLKFLRLRYIYE